MHFEYAQERISAACRRVERLQVEVDDLLVDVLVVLTGIARVAVVGLIMLVDAAFDLFDRLVDDA